MLAEGRAVELIGSGRIGSLFGYQCFIGKFEATS
jgi:hypothetical protein